LDTQWTPQRWHSSGRFSGLNVRAVNVQRDEPPAYDSMRFGGSWDVAADEHLQGVLQVEREGGDWVVDTGTRLGLKELKLSLRADHDQLDASLDASGEHLGEVAATAGVPLARKDGGWTVSPDAPLHGHLYLRSGDLSWLGPMMDSNLQSGGSLQVDADLVGSFLSPRLRGSAQGEGLSIALLDQGVRLEQGQLALRFEPEALQLERMTFSAPYQAQPRDSLLNDYKLTGVAGQLSANGRIDLEGGSGDLQISAERIPLAQRPDRWIIASGSGHARYAGHRLVLGGTIKADAGLINQPVSDRPRWSDDVYFVGQEATSRSNIPYAVDAKLDLGEHFYIRASGLEARLAGKLDVHGEPGVPLSVTGIIAAQDALFDAYGQRLQVERGIVNFQGPLDDPGLNIRATRKGLSVEAGVEVTGTVRHPSVALVSTPNVPDAEKLSWIVLGRVPDSSGVDTSLLLAAAGNILGGSSASQLGRAIGVDELSLRQKETGDALKNQVVTVGKRLNARAYLSYEHGLSDVSGVTKFTYTLTPRITIVTRTGTEDALDLFYSFRFY
jgi:translocation and assembly module TamB